MYVKLANDSRFITIGMCMINYKSIYKEIVLDKDVTINGTNSS